uniref:Secreted protein n=1 Tax=Knipowitschia caucasica TaxID=637954 RepID=A0AAV2JC55_KNICA
MPAYALLRALCCLRAGFPNLCRARNSKVAQRSGTAKWLTAAVERTRTAKADALLRKEVRGCRHYMHNTIRYVSRAADWHCAVTVVKLELICAALFLLLKSTP